MTYFRDSEGLKYLTHDFRDPTDPPDRNALLTIAKKEFDDALKKYPQTPIKLRRRIEEFAFKENPEWFVRRGLERFSILEGWSSKNFMEWYDNQKSPDIKHPCRSSKWNKLIVEPFKRSIQVRDEVLLEIIRENINGVFKNEEHNLFEIKYDEQSLKIADFYTDVDSLGLALYHIFSTIKEHAYRLKNYKVAIDFLPEFEGEYKCLRICHMGSKPTKQLTGEFLGGNLTELRNTLFGLCNWAIEGAFDTGHYRKYFLYDKSIINTERKLDYEVDGFTHLLIFY